MKNLIRGESIQQKTELYIFMANRGQTVGKGEATERGDGVPGGYR